MGQARDNFSFAGLRFAIAMGPMPVRRGIEKGITA